MSFDDGDGGSYSPGPHHHHSYSPGPSHHHNRMPSPSHFEPHPIPLYAPPYPIIAPFPPGPRDLDHRRPRSTYSRPSSDNHRSRSRSRHSRSEKHRSRSHSSDRDRSPSHRDKESKKEKAKHTLSSSFSHTSSGLGVGVLGAIVGGLAAREASEHVGGEHSHHKGKKTNNHQQLISTIVGAAVAGLGANAIEKRLEVSRKRTVKAQEEWERKFGDGGRERDVETSRGGLVGSRERRGSRGYYSSESEGEGRRRSGERRR
ncbi:hypothetical protein B0T18DRAFT_393049 [Schizothecium vesticola]|uniref:Uncharacterized protein n=1 Tax=Schizothecium vesticola TaxID=314040 RepID=A0AA40EIX3_9PEZI|nr:hypothetical protein B0T18DRAFT_393049 [Schizothecium vesticola]